MFLMQCLDWWATVKRTEVTKLSATKISSSSNLILSASFRYNRKPKKRVFQKFLWGGNLVPSTPLSCPQHIFKRRAEKIIFKKLFWGRGCIFFSIQCIKCRNFIENFNIPGVEILWKRIVSAEFRTIREAVRFLKISAPGN